MARTLGKTRRQKRPKVEHSCRTTAAVTANGENRHSPTTPDSKAVTQPQLRYARALARYDELHLRNLRHTIRRDARASEGMPDLPRRTSIRRARRATMDNARTAPGKT